MNGYKSINELTAEQMAELKENLENSLLAEQLDYSELGLAEGAEVTEDAVRKYYGNTVFSDDDFCCTSVDLFGEKANAGEAMVE